MPAMRIGINVRHLLEPNTGLGVYMHNLLSALSTIDRKTKYILYTPAKMVIPDFGKNFIQCECTTNPADNFDTCFCNTNAFINSAPDILHLQHCCIPPAKNLEKIQITITLHDLMPYVFFSKLMIRHPELIKLLSIKSLGSIRTFHHAAKAAAHIFAISNSTLKDCLESFSAVSAKTTLASNGLDPLFSKPAAQSAINQVLAEYKINTPYLLNFSGLTARKNTARLVKAWLQIPPEIRKAYKLVITGEGSKKTALSKKLASTGEDGIIFTGYLDRKKLHALLSGARASIYVSLYEGFGLPVLESLGCRVPVIASETSSLREIMPEHVFHINPFSQKDIAHAIKKVLQGQQPDPDWDLVQADLKKYSWKETARIMIRVWKQVLAQASVEIPG